MQKALMALSSSPSSIFLKLATNSLVMYLILLTIKKLKKIAFAFILKESYFKLRSLVFTFDLKRELDSSYLSVLATKFFHTARPFIDIRKLIFYSLVFGSL